MELILVISISYLLGSVPFGLILTKVFLKKDIRDEEDFHRRYGRQFGEVDDNWSFGGMENQELPMDHLEAQRKPKMRKKKINPLNGLRGVDWNPYDETLKSHGFDYRADEAPDEEEE